MKNFFKKYLYVFEFIGVAVILAVGVLAKTQESVLLYIVGLTLIVFGLLRIVPLLKTTPDNVLKALYVFEICLNIIVGIVLVIEGNKGDESSLGNLFGYLIGGVLFLRGFIYFFSTSIRRESTDYPKFFTHIGLFTVGTVIITKGGFDNILLGWVILVLSILSALFIGFSGYKNYKNSRYEQLAKDETKKSIREEKREKVQNQIEDPAPRKEDVIIPEDEKRDEVNL